MKIFKNKVGRPSNATIRNRRIICSSIIVVIVIFIGLIAINKDKIFNLKGAASKANITITYDCDTVTGESTCKNVGYKVTTSQNVKIKYRLGWEKQSGYVTEKTKSFGTQNLDNVKSLAVWVYDTKGNQIAYKSETFKQNGYPGKTYYYDQTDYSNTTFCGRSDGDTISDAGCGLVSSAMAISALSQTKVSPEMLNDYVNPTKNGGKDKYACTGNNGIEEIQDLIKNYGAEKLGIDFEVEQLWTTSDALEALNKNKGKSVAIFHSYHDAFTHAGHYYFISGITGTDRDDYIYIYDPNNGDIDSVYGSSKLRNGKWRIGDYRDISNATIFYIITKNEKKLELKCPTKANVNQNITCSVNQGGVNIRVAPESSLSSGKPIFVTTESDKTKSFTYNKATTVTVKATIGKQSVTKKIKIINPNTTTTINKTEPNPKKLKNFTLKCPSSAYTNQEFECETNISKVKISVGGAKALASGYSSTFQTKWYDKKKDIKYSDKLFTTHKDLIATDAKGNKYIPAIITATKSEYNTVKKIVKIYQKKTAATKKTNAAQKTLSFTCPSTATVGEKIICVTNTVGVVIRTSNPENLVSGYTEKFTTTKNDLTKSLSYKKAGTYYVKASKSGYKSVTKIIKVTDSQSNSNNKLVLTCPSSVYVNEPIICVSNMVGVTIRTSYPKNLAAGYTEKYVTTSSDLTKSLKYTKAGTYYVKASKAGYGEVKKTITVKNRVAQTTVNKNAGKDIAIMLLSIDTPSGLFANKKDKIFKVRLDSKGDKVKYYTYVVCNTLNECKASNAYTIVEDKYGESAVTERKPAIVGFTDTLTLRTNSESVTGKTYYLRIATYDKYSASNMIHKAVFQINVDNNNKHSLKLLEDTVWFK